MALQLSVEADAFLQQGNISPNIILEIEGFSNLYGTVKVTRVAKFNDGYTFSDGLKFDEGFADPNSKDYISFSGTTSNITQQLNQDKGGSSSVTSFKIRMTDINGELTNAFSPGVTVDDILGNDATVYYQVQGSVHPRDSARLFVGVISAASFGQGFVDLRIDHPEQLKRQELLPLITGKLTADITDSNTALLADTTEGVISAQDSLETYIRINDEIIKVGGTTAAGFSSLTRGQFGTIAAAHSEGDEYETFYRLQGGPIDLSLKLMLSGGDNDYFATANASRLEEVSATTSIEGAIFFPENNIQDRLGLVVGDKVAVISGASGGNLVSYREILSFGTTSSGSYVVIDYDFTPEIELEALCYFKSKYDLLNFGAGLKPYQVDVAQFESLETSFGAQFFEYDYYLKDTINLKEFMDEKLFYPCSLFSLPRKGRVSVGISAPPIVGPNAKTISADNVTNATRVMMSRSINQAFYNSIAWKFDEDAVEDKFKAATVTTSEDSFNRVKVGNRTLTIESGGIRDTQSNRNIIDAISTRFLDRYQYGAEKVSFDINFETAFTIEPGDTVILEGDTMGLADITNGSRNFLTRVMEVTNKSINLKTGKASIELTDTNLSTNARYGTFSPASYVGTGSTTSQIVIERSFGTTELELERDKWSDYILQDIVIRSYDHSTIYETTLLGFSPSDPNILLVSPPVGLAPSQGFIVESPPYDETSKQSMKFWKALHTYAAPQVEATGGSTTTITVDAGDVDKFFVGSPVRIHLDDYSEDESASVAEISGTTLTLNKTLSFTITSSHLIDAIGFGDKGVPYSFF